jgi:hypothetical protein
MLKRKPRGGTVYILISPDNIEYEVEYYSKMLKTFNLDDYMVRKFLNTGLPIPDPGNKGRPRNGLSLDRMKNTIGWIVSIK